jgi:phospholipase C
VNHLFPLALAALCLTTPASAQIAAFQHIVVVVQENRTPDNMFQGLCPITKPSACNPAQPSSTQYNIQTKAWLDKTSKTGTTDPMAVPFGLGYDLDHGHSGFIKLCDLNVSTKTCAMNGAANVPCHVISQPCPTRAALAYVDNSQGVLDPYLDLVKAYGWGNYMFQTNQGPSYPAHQFIFGASSAPTWRDDHEGNFASGNVGKRSGCIAAPTTTLPVLNAHGVVFEKVFPCFDRKTLADLLHEQGKSWRWYGRSQGGGWMAPNSIKHICVAVDQKCTGNEFRSNVEINPPNVLSDISTNCKLRDVAWVTPDGENSDHMGFLQNTGGPSWVAQIVNAVGTSPCTNKDGSSYWNSTAIIITWDDWGGYYDHVPPYIEPYPQGGYQLGFRVPLIVVSAYTAPKFISNTPEDFGSIVRFIEQNFGIKEGALTFADERSTTDLTEFFSLNDPPRPFQPIKAPLSAEHFLTAPVSGIPPDND